MINPRAVKQFLKLARDNHVWMKKLSNKKLDRTLDDLGFVSSSKKPLRKHQKVCILLGLAYPQFAFWLDMGTGKTRITLELLNHYWRTGVLKRGLILATSDESIRGWEKQIKRWKIKIPYAAVGNSSTREKWQSVAELGAGLIIATYPGFNHMFTMRVQKVKKGKVVKRKSRGRMKAAMTMKPDLKRIKTFAENLDAFVWDESPHVGNHQGLGFKISKKLSKSCTIRYALAGVPFGKDPQLIWSQQYLVDRGESLGETLGIFRAAFYDEKKGYFTRFEYKFRKEMEEKLASLMAHRSIAYTVDECLDLPPVTPETVEVQLPTDAQSYFEQAMKKLRKARGDMKETQNIFLRMRQMSSGFIGYTADEEGTKAQMVFDENPKLDALIRNIEDMPKDCKFVIFHEFTVSGRMIMDALAKKGIKAGWIWGGTKNARKILDSFDNDPPKKMKGLVCNWKKASESLEFQRANYLHYFESPVGVIPRKQSERRPFRDGQTRAGFMYDYVATPADRRILDFHETGENFFKALVRDPNLLRD